MIVTFHHLCQEATMIKLLSLIVFITAFVWTWFLFHSQSKISQATHAGIQSKLMILIEESIRKSRPNSSEFEILKIYTQDIDENQVSAKFSYKYSDQLAAASSSETTEKVSQQMTGEAILYRSISENPTDDKWIIKSVKAENSGLEFLQGTTVNSEDLEPSTAPPPEEKKTE